MKEWVIHLNRDIRGSGQKKARAAKSRAIMSDGCLFNSDDTLDAVLIPFCSADKVDAVCHGSAKIVSGVPDHGADAVAIDCPDQLTPGVVDIVSICHSRLAGSFQRDAAVKRLRICFDLH